MRALNSSGWTPKTVDIQLLTWNPVLSKVEGSLKTLKYPQLSCSCHIVHSALRMSETVLRRVCFNTWYWRRLVLLVNDFSCSMNNLSMIHWTFEGMESKKWASSSELYPKSHKVREVIRVQEFFTWIIFSRFEGDLVPSKWAHAVHGSMLANHGIAVRIHDWL